MRHAWLQQKGPSSDRPWALGASGALMGAVVVGGSGRDGGERDQVSEV